MTGDVPTLGDFPELLARLVNVKPGDRNPFAGAGGVPAVTVRQVFAEIQALHEAVAWLLEREAGRQA